jgi:hypothetical protein
MKGGRFDEEIVPIEVPQKKGAALGDSNRRGPREATSLEASAAPPAFKQKRLPRRGKRRARPWSSLVRGDGETRAPGRWLGIAAQATSGVEPKLVMMPRLALKEDTRARGLESGGCGSY